MNDLPIEMIAQLLRNPRAAARALVPYALPRIADYALRNYMPAEAKRALARAGNAYAGQRDRFLVSLHDREAALYPVIGARGSGKTAYALALAEHIGRPAYAANIPERQLPEWVEAVDLGDVEGLSPGSVVIVDDAGQVASSRDYRSAGARDLEDVLSVVRHRGLVLIATTTASNLVHQSLLDADAFFFKPPSILRRAAERRELREMVEIAAEAWEGIAGGERKRMVFAISDDPPFGGFISYDLPAGWSEGLSKNKRYQAQYEEEGIR